MDKARTSLHVTIVMDAHIPSYGVKLVLQTQKKRPIASQAVYGGS
jgi:hypothetical protein